MRLGTPHNLLLSITGLVVVEVDDSPFLKRFSEGFGVGIGTAVTFNRHAFVHGGAEEFLQDGPGDRTADVDFTGEMVGHD